MAILRMTREEYKKNYGQNPESYGIAPIEVPEEKRNLVQKVAGFLGIEKFGQALGQGAFQFTKEKKMLDEMLDKGQISPEEYENITTAITLWNNSENAGQIIKKGTVKLYKV